MSTLSSWDIAGGRESKTATRSIATSTVAVMPAKDEEDCVGHVVRSLLALGIRYLDHSHGSCLIHGDYFPGSWLKTRDQVYVIDPEFCFFGPPEFDLGMMMGHLYLAGVFTELIASVYNLYTAAASINLSLALQFAGVEIMRRLIGVAQLPLRYDLPEKRRLLELSRRLVLS
jgi:5-methylthioribose kinase